MAHPLTPFAGDIRQAIEDVSCSARGTLESLRAPYAERAKAGPTSFLGAPHPLPRQAITSPLPALADMVVRLGGGAAPLLALARADEQLDDLVEGYVAGRFAANATASWLDDLQAFQEELEHLVAGAREALPRWNQLDPSPKPALVREPEMLPEILTPELAVARMGHSISVAGLRARIRKGQAGPWKRVGGKHQIATSAFLAWHRASREEAAEGAKRRGEALEQLVAQHPPRRGGPWAAGGLDTLTVSGKKPS